MIKIQNSRHMQVFSLFMATTSLATGTAGAVTIPTEPPPTFLESVVSIITDKVVEATDGLSNEMSECAAKIDAFYEKNDLPLAGYGKVFAQAAENEGVDCEIATLAAAIGFRESTGGKFTPGHGDNESYNAFGFGCSDAKGKKCKNYTGFEHAIEVVIRNLAGNNPSTERYYKDKSITDIINTYNPPRVLLEKYGDSKWYLNRVTSTMKTIQNMDITESGSTRNNQLAQN